MNSRKAKKLRKLIYKDSNPREREYGAVIHKKEIGKALGIPEKLLPVQVINIGQLDEVGTKKRPRQISRRRIYQAAKKIVRHVKIVNMEKELFN